MARCDACRQEMNDRVGCTVEFYSDFADGIVRERAPYLHDVDETVSVAEASGCVMHCRDCAVPCGSFHHSGCDAERCPKCSWQAISCPCTENEEWNSDD